VEIHIPLNVTHVVVAGHRYRIRSRQFNAITSKDTTGGDMPYMTVRLSGCPEHQTPNSDHEPGMF
jgi:hypothetical protein